MKTNNKSKEIDICTHIFIYSTYNIYIYDFSLHLPQLFATTIIHTFKKKRKKKNLCTRMYVCLGVFHACPVAVCRQTLNTQFTSA